MITSVKRPDWEPVPLEGIVNVEGKVFWPKGVQHCLWTTDSEMTTLMVHPLGFQAS